MAFCRLLEIYRALEEGFSGNTCLRRPLSKACTLATQADQRLDMLRKKSKRGKCHAGAKQVAEKSDERKGTGALPQQALAVPRTTTLSRPLGPEVRFSSRISSQCIRKAVPQ